MPATWISDTFRKLGGLAGDLFDQFKNASPQDWERTLARTAANALAPSRVGQYSVMHDKAVYQLGYNEKETCELQWM
jgi:hypothetical protein